MITYNEKSFIILQTYRPVSYVFSLQLLAANEKEK
jgi:hypothetical protein